MRDAPPDGFASGQGNLYTDKPKDEPEGSASDGKSSPSSDIATLSSDVATLSSDVAHLAPMLLHLLALFGAFLFFLS